MLAFLSYEATAPLARFDRMGVDLSNSTRMEDRRFLWRLHDNHLLLVSAHQRYYHAKSFRATQRMEAFWDDKDHAMTVGRNGKNVMFEKTNFWFQLEALP